MEISLLEEVKARIDETMSHETEELLAMEVFNEDEKALFRVTTVERSPQSTRVKLK
jgi:hypothetical protein